MLVFRVSVGRYGNPAFGGNSICPLFSLLRLCRAPLQRLGHFHLLVSLLRTPQAHKYLRQLLVGSGAGLVEDEKAISGCGVLPFFLLDQERPQLVVGSCIAWVRLDRLM
jgi:hypothetical protein